jgi:hypothetical protein
MQKAGIPPSGMYTGGLAEQRASVDTSRESTKWRGFGTFAPEARASLSVGENMSSRSSGKGFSCSICNMCVGDTKGVAIFGGVECVNGSNESAKADMDGKDVKVASHRRTCFSPFARTERSEHLLLLICRGDVSRQMKLRND